MVVAATTRTHGYRWKSRLVMAQQVILGVRAGRDALQQQQRLHYTEQRGNDDCGNDQAEHHQ